MVELDNPQILKLEYAFETKHFVALALECNIFLECRLSWGGVILLSEEGEEDEGGGGEVLLRGDLDGDTVPSQQENYLSGYQA